MSYFFAAGRAEIAHGDVHDPVRQAELLRDLFLIRQQLVVRLL